MARSSAAGKDPRGFIERKDVFQELGLGEQNILMDAQSSEEGWHFAQPWHLNGTAALMGYAGSVLGLLAMHVVAPA